MKSLNALIVVSLAALILFAAQTESRLTFNRYHIHVVNGLGSGKTLFVHCRSGDDDLGRHILATNQEFKWSFWPRLFGGTLFWCYLRPGNDNVHAHVNVFEEDPELLANCDDAINCIWVAKNDAVYMKDLPQGTEVRKQGWEIGAV